MSDEVESLSEDISQYIIDQVDDADSDKIKTYVKEKVENYFEYKVKDKDTIRERIMENIEEDIGVSVEEETDEEEIEGSPVVEIQDIVNNDPPEYVSVKGKVVDIWDNDSDSMKSIGLISDGNKTTKYLIWEPEEEDERYPDEIQEGESYFFKDFGTSVYNGRKEINSTSVSAVEEIDEEFEQEASDVNGCVVKIHDTSGLIKRDEDGQVVENTEDAENDLRLKMTLDDGVNTYTVIANKEVTEKVTGITLNQAVEMARDKLDRSVVLNKIKDDLMLQQVQATGISRGEYFIAEEVEVGKTEENVQEKASELLMKVRNNVKGDTQ